MEITIIEDTRNQIGKHNKKNLWFAANGIKVLRSKLPVGDYALMTNLSVCIDTKKNLQEICGNVTHQHKRFVEELTKAHENGIKLYILCEHGSGINCLEDVKNWANPRIKQSPKATTGETLFKILHSMETRHGCEFVFCSKAETGRRIMELLGGSMQ